MLKNICFGFLVVLKFSIAFNKGEKMLLFLRFLFIFAFIALEATPPKLLIKIPTRARYMEFFRALDSYYENLSGEIPYHFVITCDSNDSIMNSPRARQRIRQYPNLSIFYGDSKSKIEAFNNDIDKFKDFDILLVGSDDMIPQVHGYDLEIVRCMELHFPNLDGILHYNDGYTSDLLITYPVIGRNYYDLFGYVFHPDYKGFFCDNELTDVSRMIGKYVYCDLVLFEHQHPANGKGKHDTLYQINDSYFQTDRITYDARKKMTFNLPEKIIVNPVD